MSKTYEIITDCIVAKIESGVVPWHRPWEEGIPRNLISNKAYRGINVFLTEGDSRYQETLSSDAPRGRHCPLPISCICATPLPATC
jgi:antirestriction protein ArdC